MSWHSGLSRSSFFLRHTSSSMICSRSIASSQKTPPQILDFSRDGNAARDSNEVTVIFIDHLPRNTPLFYGSQGGGKRADYKLRFFIRQLYGTAGLAAGLSRALQADDAVRHRVLRQRAVPPSDRRLPPFLTPERREDIPGVRPSMRPAGSVCHAIADRTAGERFNFLIEPLRCVMPIWSESVITIGAVDTVTVRGSPNRC